MFNKKKKEIEQLKKKLEQTEIERNRYKSRVYELEEKQYANDSIIKALEQELYNKELKYYKKYDYAILINGTKVKVWNEDRFEKHISEITFMYNPNINELPKLMIDKVPVGKGNEV